MEFAICETLGLTKAQWDALPEGERIGWIMYHFTKSKKQQRATEKAEREERARKNTPKVRRGR